MYLKMQTLQPVLRVTDKWGRIVMADYNCSAEIFEIPQRVHLNLAVRTIEVAETNLKNQNWDYKLNPDEEKPEVCWALLLGNKRLSLSPYAAIAINLLIPPAKATLNSSFLKAIFLSLT